jgi:hypothetical protein
MSPAAELKPADGADAFRSAALSASTSVSLTARDPVTSRHRRPWRALRSLAQNQASQTQYCDYGSGQPIEPSGLGGEINVIAPNKTLTQRGALHCARDDSRKAKVSGDLYALCDDIDEYAIKGNLVGPDPCRAANSSLCTCDIRNDCPKCLIALFLRCRCAFGLPSGWAPGSSARWRAGLPCCGPTTAVRCSSRRSWPACRSACERGRTNVKRG